MTLKVIHLIDDQKLGGVALAVDSLCSSCLADEFDFEIRHINLSLWKPVRFQADIICLHAAASWRKLPAMALLKLCNLDKKIIYQEHHYSEGFVIHQVKAQWRFLLMLTLYYSLTDKVAAVSKAQGHWLLKLRLVSSNKLFITGQAKPLNALTSLVNPSFTWPLVIGAYGRLHHQKGFDLLIKAFSRVPKHKLELRIAGAGEQEVELRSLAGKDHHGEARITFLGEIEDVPAFLRHCDLIIIPSRWEPFGLTCQEALAAGKVVVASKVDGLNEQITDVNSIDEGHLVVALDGLTEASLVAEIEQQIICIETLESQLADGDLVYGLSHKQRELVAQSWPFVVNKWRELLHSV